MGPNKQFPTKWTMCRVVLILCASFTCFGCALLPGERNSSETNKGTSVWSVEPNSPVITTPILVNENIIVRTEDEILSIDKNNGDVLWRVQSKAYSKWIDDYAIPREFVANSKYLIAGEESNGIGVYSTTTGDLIWKMTGDADFVDGVQIIGNILIVVRHDENLTIYDLDSKLKLWETKVPSRMNLAIAANTSVVAFAAEHFLKVYDLNSGSLLETISYDNAVMGELLLDGSTLFVVYNPEGGEGLTIESLQLESLTKNWTDSVGVIGHPYLSVSNQQLYLYDQALVSLDKGTGTLLWKEDTQDFYSRPVAHDNNLYFVTSKGMDKNLCTVLLKTGALANCTTMDSVGLVGSGNDLVGALVVDSKLIVSYDDKIIAYPITE